MSNPVTITAEPGTPFIDVTREFEAPVDAVYRAYVDPDLVSQWLGPRDLSIRDVEYDVRPGGIWRFVHTDDAGNAFEFYGVFHSVEPDRITRTFEFGGVPGHVILESIRFEPAGEGRSRVSTHSAFQAVEDRDGMLASGMERGQTEGFERLDELLAD